MLFHAPRSRYIDPGRPPAAAGGLMSQYPDLVLGAQQPLDCRQLRQDGRRVLTRSFDTRSKEPIDLVAEAIKPGSSEPQLTDQRTGYVHDPVPTDEVAAECHRVRFSIFAHHITSPLK